MLDFRKGQDEIIAPHRTAPHRTAPHRTAPLLLLLTTVLAACGSQDTIQASKLSAVPLNEAALLSPQGMPVAHTNSSGTGLGALSKDEESALTKDGWIEHTFSTGEKLLFRNYKGTAVYGDIAYAPTKDMAKYIQSAEDYIHGIGLNRQSLGLDPQGCSKRTFFCSIYTTAYMWAGHRVDYYFGVSINGEFTQDQKDSITAQIDTWNNSGASIRWYPSPGASNSKVGFFPSIDESYCGQAYVGYQGRYTLPDLNYININVNNPTASNTCILPSTGTVNHEMGHVVGLPHEQNRCDRDTFVVIGSGYANQSIQKCGEDVRYYGTGFDYNSIMLYRSPFVYANPVPPSSNTYNGYYNSYVIPGEPGGRIFTNSTLTPTDIQTINGIYDSPYNPRP